MHILARRLNFCIYVSSTDIRGSDLVFHACHIASPGTAMRKGALQVTADAVQFVTPLFTALRAVL